MSLARILRARLVISKRGNDAGYGINQVCTGRQSLQVLGARCYVLDVHPDGAVRSHPISGPWHPENS